MALRVTTWVEKINHSCKKKCMFIQLDFDVPIIHRVNKQAQDLSPLLQWTSSIPLQNTGTVR